MIDKIEKTENGSVIQHGKLNDRVYLIKLAKKDTGNIFEIMNELVQKNHYSKIFCKVPIDTAPLFLSNGFITEAIIPKFYNNRKDAFLLSKFIDSKRSLTNNKEQFSKLSILLHAGQKPLITTEIPSIFSFNSLNPVDAEEIAIIYRKVFDSYPFPIFNASYIRSSMKENVQYFGVRFKGELIALASAEVDHHGQNAEMTDFATLPAFRGNKLSTYLLENMEFEMKRKNISTLYTIARLNSIAMNKTFLNLHYNYAGTLINNTNISGKIENMNVYYKQL